METFELFNQFPEDVQRLIFECAFEGNPRKTQLALVSRKVNRWVEPLIYQTIVTSRISDRAAETLNDFGTSRKSKEFYSNHVKSLSVDELTVVQFVEDLLRGCDNLINLAWWSITHDRKKWASILLSKPCRSMRKMSVYSGIFPPEIQHPFRAPIFQTLTHLDVGLPPSHFPKPGTEPDPIYGKPRRLSWDGLQYLECLTHLHLDLKLAVSFQKPGNDAQEFRLAIFDVLSHLPPGLCYLSILLPFGFLQKAANLPIESRQMYEDLIWGRVDSRIVVGYPSKRWNILTKKMTDANITTDGFSKYLLPRAQDDKSLRIQFPKPQKDFWEEAEEMIRRRNRELSM